MLDKRGKKVVALCYAVLLFALLYPLSAYSASSIDITVKQRVIIAQKRGIVTLPFTVVNHSNRTLQLTESIDLPDGWRVLASSGAFTLAAGERKLRLIHVLASSDVPAGKYTIPYQVVSRDELTIRAKKNINVIIKSTSKLSVDIVDKPDLVLAGEKYTVKVQVTNKGNTPVSLAVIIKDTSGYLSTFEPRHLTLKPSQKTMIRINARIPSSLKKSSFHTLKLSLRDKSISVDKSIKTQIISLTPEGTGLYHSIPSSITTSYTSDGDNGILQTEIVAAGDLDEKGEHDLDLLYRDTQTNTVSSLGSDSEKRISYHNSTLGIHLGDRSFPLAGITDNGFYGEGAEIEYHPADKNWNFRAFAAKHYQQGNEEKDSINTASISGVEVGYRVERDLELTVNALIKENNDNNLHKEMIAGIDLYWNKYTKAEVNLSLAKDKEGHAFRLQQNGSLGALNYDLEIQHADADFDGLIKDIKSENLTGIYSFNDDSNYLRANLYHSQHNRDKDETRRITEEKNIRLGMGHYFNNSHQDSLFAEVFRREAKDQRTKPDYDYSEQGIRMDYQKSINQQFRLNTILEHIAGNNTITKKKISKNKGSLTLAYTPNDKYHFGFNIDSTLTGNNTLNDSSDSLGYGLNAAVRFNSRQHFSGYWRHSENLGSSENSASKNDSLQLNYNHTFNSGVSLGASISTDTLDTNNNDLDYLLTLTVPFDTPLYKYKNIGSLKGKVFNKALQQPVTHAIVGVAGQYAVTDKQGNYQFKAIREGEYAFTTNLTKTNLGNYLIENEQQQKTTLTANQSTIHHITLVPGTGIKGQVLSYTVSQGSVLQSNKDEIKPSGGVESLLVTLVSTKNSEIVHKVLTSEGGFFSFNGIKAGQWFIQVTDPQQVIKDARLEEPERTIELRVGEEQDIVFKAIPLIKKIRKIGPSNGFSVSGE